MKNPTSSSGKGRLVGLPSRPPSTRAWRTSVVGLTADGYVPVVERSVASTGRSVIGLPSISIDVTPPDCLDQMREGVSARLRQDFGYRADELIAMGSESATGQRGPAFFLAPLLAAADWRARAGFVPGLYEVALGAIPEWLRQRGLAGASESPEIRQGLVLAQEYLPLWAQSKVRDSLRELQALPTRAIPSA